MLCFRLIARLDIRSEWLIKTRNLEGVWKVGNPNEYALRYDRQKIDELLFIDCVASLYGRNSLHGLITDVGGAVYSPCCVAGGIRSRDDVRTLFLAGADKVGINTAAVASPSLLGELARRFGRQAVAIQIDAKQRSSKNWEVFCDGGREPTGRDVIEWAKEATDRGAGEVLLTSIDHEGTGQGCDLQLCEAVARAVSTPVIAAGGVGTAQHVADVALTGVNGVAMAGVLHYGKVGLAEMRAALSEAGIPVRKVK